MVLRQSLLAAGLAASAVASAAQPHQSDLDRGVDALIARMTLQEKAAQLQDGAPAIPRLGIPAYSYWNEALHGVARS